MSEPEAANRSRIKHHFAQRVTHQARQVLEVWQRLQYDEWSASGMQELLAANALLLRHAERFEQPEHCELACQINACLHAIQDNYGRLNSELINALNQLLQSLSRTGLRTGEQAEQRMPAPLRKPIYLALQDQQRAQQLVQQLHFFGLGVQAFNDHNDLNSAMAARHPATILMDVDFRGEGQGLILAAALQQGMENKLPLLFFSNQEADTPTRLAAVRAGGQGFFTQNLDASNLLERIENISLTFRYEPYKVLVVDDSRAQSTHTERVLNNAGIITRTINEPLKAMAELIEFQPDLIILDMYMPGCSGIELAKVIRQNDRHVSVPIIFLSAEDDLDKQLEAMSEGGEDFLTKPVKPRHLVATVRNRVARARNLKARMVRDSLTGLYNHTHTLQLLEDARLRTLRINQPLCFAMLDIDHFKKVNDTHGHPIGDKVIKSLALFLKQRLRKSDYIGRYGGEEFAVVLPDTNLASAHKVLDDIRQRFADIKFPGVHGDFHCTFSCGIAELQPQMDAKEISKRADEALYLAKHGGRNQLACFPVS